MNLYPLSLKTKLLITFLLVRKMLVFRINIKCIKIETKHALNQYQGIYLIKKKAIVSEIYSEQKLKENKVHPKSSFTIENYEKVHITG